MSTLSCPHCSRAILHKNQEGCLRFRISGEITIADDGLVKAQCFFCKAEVRVPLELSKSHTQPRFVVRSIVGS